MNQDKLERWKKIYNMVMWLGFLLWIMETMYFGWNMTPQSGAERVADFIVAMMMFCGFVGSIALKAVTD